MNVKTLLKDTLTKSFRGAAVDIEMGDDGRYTLTVVHERFYGSRPADRQASVYDVLSRLPPEAVARIADIVCLPEAV